MLILERRIDEEVMLDLPDGRRVTVMVVRLGKCKCRLGFKAAKDIRILRKEILDKLSPVAPAISTGTELID